MNELDLELNEALDALLPENLYAHVCDALDEEDDPRLVTLPVQSKSPFLRRFRAIAACVMLVLCLSGTGYYFETLAVDSVVDIDVNPSIELSVNRHNQVLDAVVLNEDAEDLLSDVSLRHTELTVALDTIVRTLIDKGYLTSGQSNSILVSVQNGSAERAEAIRQVVVTGIDGSLSTNQVSAQVLNQTMERSVTAESFAREHQISLGKAVLVLNLAGKDESLKAEELAELNLKELAQVVRERKIDISDIVDYEEDESIRENLEDSVEEINERNQLAAEDLISLDLARDTALEDAGVSAEQVTHLRIELDSEDEGWVYEVEFLCGGKEYEYEVDALSGAILDREIERSSTS